ncbi:3alpha(or 20beta)-hydroxysteroid dehydrogenase [Nocardioides luteus]|uniref:3-alpha-hydroxysteroid dehydrogenase n=1 Tax=Nocardioides luteus TaxID=1844 RepID=A0ABQ5STM8_9ACTN|nr:glucose 1-dehydrogenase [Nocardioides luteus]MDR7309106.1 3alpha(or 20beta)-hydroxysteroid dehydrogenase [Nocardioides luteus]GGR49749.1 3-alpha-hydroxysteroid dehydrogenase [Nocardioides luteus]GLJ67512.1 3-alpha-hydroxysteroid dehydrogenase [Nocardioides luteus]
MNRFSNQTVLVTGGAGGQGASHVRAFHAEGANVLIGERAADRGAALADELGPRARLTELDVTDEESWAAAIRTAEETFGGLNVLVNNAGIQNPPALIEHTDQATWSRILDVNLTGAFLGTKAAAPALRRAGGGSIVNIASTMGLGGTAHYAPYVASKWAVRGLTRTAALELGRDGVRVNTIHPGVIATPFIHEPAAGASAAIADFYSPEPFAIPRLGEPADVTELLLFLSSPAASFITGAEYVIDGGLQLGPALQSEPA